MLVLSRKLGETILIGDGISITVSEIRRSRIRLAIVAPADVKILRSEIEARPTSQIAEAVVDEQSQDQEPMRGMALDGLALGELTE